MRCRQCTWRPISNRPSNMSAVMYDVQSFLSPATLGLESLSIVIRGVGSL